jgi:hypothetical protein
MAAARIYSGALPAHLLPMSSSKIRSLSIRKQVLLVCLLILGLWLLAVLLSLLPAVKEYTNQPVADAFSGINALFAGCAFGGVILTIWLQISELQDTREELQKTAQANLEMAHANVAIARHAGERSVLDLFQTYCSEYFQQVKDSSMSVLIPCVASKAYCDFVVSRLFVAGQLPLPEAAWPEIARVSYCSSLDEFRQQEQRWRYKLDELINFFTLLTGQSTSRDVISRCDFSYSWWRPLLWMLATLQEERYAAQQDVRRYATPLYLKSVVQRLDEVYGFAPLETPQQVWAFFTAHPKVRGYGMDPAYLALAQAAPPGEGIVGQTEPATVA